MQVNFLKRLSAGLAIATPLAYWLATTPMKDLAPTVAESSLLRPSPVSQVRLASTTDGSKNLMSFADAFESQTSDLLWSCTLPLDRQSPDTIENVRIVAEAVDMTALRQNQMFSFNDVVGVRTEEKGYRPGLMYSNGDVVMGVGGGICIASTMLYKAALESGLRVIERHPHSGPVSYADPGRDAAVSYGWADIRFKNNTDGMLLIRSEVRGTDLVVALYGKKKPGQIVEITSEDYELIPYTMVEKEDVTIPVGEVIVQQKAREGYSVTTVRSIKQDGKLVSREVMSRDTVLPRNKIVLVTPKHEDTHQITLPFETPTQDHSGPALPLPDSAPPTELTLPTSERTTPTASE